MTTIRSQILGNKNILGEKRLLDTFLEAPELEQKKKELTDRLIYAYNSIRTQKDKINCLSRKVNDLEITNAQKDEMIAELEQTVAQLVQQLEIFYKSSPKNGIMNMFA